LHDETTNVTQIMIEFLQGTTFTQNKKDKKVGGLA